MDDTNNALWEFRIASLADYDCRCQLCAAQQHSSAKDDERPSSADEDYPVPDLYAEAIPALRAACATPVSVFENKWKRERLAELEAEHVEMASDNARRVLAEILRAAEARRR